MCGTPVRRLKEKRERRRLCALSGPEMLTANKALAIIIAKAHKVEIRCKKNKHGENAPRCDLVRESISPGGGICQGEGPA